MKIIVKNESTLKNEFKLVNDTRYRHYQEILTELENDVKNAAENENKLIITPAVPYHKSEDSGFLIFTLESVDVVDNELTVTYHQSSSVGA